jgi:hypothetical protein
VRVVALRTIAQSERVPAEGVLYFDRPGRHPITLCHLPTSGHFRLRVCLYPTEFAATYWIYAPGRHRSISSISSVTADHHPAFVGALSDPSFKTLPTTRSQLADSTDT